jgi:hypothetical protein
MIHACLVAALTVAQAMPTPSVRTPAVSFEDGLQRLIDHAPNAFSSELGQRLGTSGDAETYALNFTVTGLTECRVSRGAHVANVTCDVYNGSDGAVAAHRFDDLERGLRAFAGEKGRVSVESFSLSTENATIASYWPSDAVDVTLEKEVSNGAYSVVFKVARNPS